MAFTLRRVGICFSLLMTALALSASCGSPTSASGASVTDVFSGTLTSASNIAISGFTTSGSGDVTLTLVSLSQSVSVELSIGVVSGGACTIQAVASSLAVGQQWQTSVSGAGTYCVEIDDVATANAPASLDYNVSIVHPG